MAFFSFLGANQYLKEVEEQERYEEAFDLKKQSLGISKENLELQKETLELKKIIQEQNLIKQMASVSGFGGLPTSTTSSSKTTANVGNAGKDNKFFAKAIKLNYPYITNDTLVSLMANTNNARGTMKTVYDFLNSTKKQFNDKNRLTPEGRIPDETLSYIFNNTLVATDNPYKDLKDLEKQFGFKLSETGKGLLDAYTNLTITNIQLPKVTDPLGLPETEDISFLKKEAYDVAENFYKQEVNAVNRAISFYQKKFDNRTLNPEEQILFKWLTERSGKLAEIKGFTAGNPTNLINLYGTRDSYNYMRTNSPMAKKFFLPEQPPSMSLNIEAPPVVVFNHKHMITLRNLGVLREGQRVEFQDTKDADGSTKQYGIVPPKGQK